MAKISMQKGKDLTVDEGFEIFIKRCIIRNLSAQTVKTYRNHYAVFSRCVGGSNLISSITSYAVDDFIICLKEQNQCNDVSINSYLRTIRTFLYYMMEHNYIEPFKIDKLKVDKKIKEVYTDTELRALLKKTDLKVCSFGEFRMWVFSNFLLGTGMRLSSALNLLNKDIDFDNALIYINKSKNRKAQVIPLSKTLSTILTEYLQYRGGTGDDYLFCSVEGNKAANRSYQDGLNHYHKKRGVMKTGAHRYRHTFAKNWILNGGDVFRLQKMLGHSDLTVVREYVQMFGNDLSKDFDKFNPLDSMGINQNTERIKLR